MNLFKCRCPLEKILNRDLGEDKCFNCEFYVNGKCQYKQIMQNKLRLASRGIAALTKLEMLQLEERKKVDRGLAKRAEWNALQMSGLNQSEQTQYLRVSKIYGDRFDNASNERRQEIKWRIKWWKTFMEDGLTPVEAHHKSNDLDYNAFNNSVE